MTKLAPELLAHTDNLQGPDLRQSTIMAVDSHNKRVTLDDAGSQSVNRCAAQEPRKRGYFLSPTTPGAFYVAAHSGHVGEIR
jgi:hypothetical protein